MMHTADHLNLRHDPRVVVSMESDQYSAGGGPHPPFQFHLVLHGRAEIIDGAAPEVAPFICANYGTQAPPDTPPGYVTRITVDRVGGVGPWVS